MENKPSVNIKPEVNVSDYEIGAIICRLQVNVLHPGHKALIDLVCANHKKVILFLGVPVIENTKNNCLDFATRKIMVQNDYPNITILPLKDQRYNDKWSKTLDDNIKIPFGERSALLYGSRDSFIPYYSGKYKTVELLTDSNYSGTEIRKEVSRELLSSEDFRAGVIHAIWSVRPVTYPTVDIVAYNENGQLLLAKKPNEPKYRFIGGFVDSIDSSLEEAARREFHEETSGSEIGDLTYVGSDSIKDWRYVKEESGIMSTLFIGKFMFGRAEASDDIEILKWIDKDDINENMIMDEHKPLFIKLLNYLDKHNILIKNK